MNEQGSTARPSLDELWASYDIDVISQAEEGVHPDNRATDGDIAKGRADIAAAIKAESWGQVREALSVRYAEDDAADERADVLANRLRTTLELAARTIRNEALLSSTVGHENRLRDIADELVRLAAPGVDRG